MTVIDGSVSGDDVTGDKRSSQLRSLEQKVKCLQQENEALIRVSNCCSLQSLSVFVSL